MSKHRPPETPMFPGHVKPVHVGVYRVFSRFSEYAYWNGEKWGWAYANVQQANRYRSTAGATQSKEWCGLIEKVDS